jgi:hypothetical protein
VSATRFDQAVARIDEANADDPDTIEIDGETRPKEVAHAELMTQWVSRLDPAADEAQLLAARAHHLRRWVVPRADYPEGRAGYLRWRRDAARRQADEVAEILESVGYEPETIDRVQRLIRKEGLRGATGRSDGVRKDGDPAVQIHEDALCLVFLSTQFSSLAADLGDEHMVEVLAKTVRKMSPAGLAAVAELPLTPELAALVDRALQVS